MKKFLTFYFALVLSVAQGFAASIDPLRNGTSGLGISGFRDSLGIVDGFSLKDSLSTVGPDDLELYDGVTGVGINCLGKKIDVYYAGNTISSLHYSMTAGKSVTKEITVKTSKIKKDMTVEVSGDDDYRFKIEDGISELNHNKTNSSRGVKLKITFTAYNSGYYTAKLVIKEKGLFGKKRTITLTGTANSIITVYTTSLNFASAGQQTFKIKCERAGHNVKLDLKGANANLFKVTPKVISDSVANNEHTITVKFSPRYNTYKANAYISIYCEHDDKCQLVYLTYNSQVASVQSVDFPAPEDESQEGLTEELETATSCEGDYPAVDDVEMLGDVKISADNHPTTGLEEMTSNVRIFAENQTIVIDSPIRQNAIISDIAGRSMSVSLQEGRNEIPVNANGIHIVRVGEQSKKLMIR